MTLRRRLTAAAALAVAAVAVTLGVVGYLTTRSHLLGELAERAAPARDAVPGPATSRDGGGPRAAGSDPRAAQLPQADDHRVPPPARLGGRDRLFPVGIPQRPGGRRPGRLDGPAAGRRARCWRSPATAAGSFYFSTTVNGTHVEILTIGDSIDHKAVRGRAPAHLRGLGPARPAALLRPADRGRHPARRSSSAPSSRAPRWRRSSASRPRPSRSPARWTARGAWRRPAPTSCAGWRPASTRLSTRSSARSSPSAS